DKAKIWRRARLVVIQNPVRPEWHDATANPIGGGACRVRGVLRTSLKYLSVASVASAILKRKKLLVEKGVYDVKRPHRVEGDGPRQNYRTRRRTRLARWSERDRHLGACVREVTQR